MGEVTLFPLTYVSVPSHGSKMTHPVRDKINVLMFKICSIYVNISFLRCSEGSLYLLPVGLWCC